jgi:hypothetical protein
MQEQIETKVKFTPGPWEVDNETIYGATGYLIADVTSHYPENESIQAANARLIAAAPTMYDYISSRANAGDEHAQAILGAINASR